MYRCIGLAFLFAFLAIALLPNVASSQGTGTLAVEACQDLNGDGICGLTDSPAIGRPVKVFLGTCKVAQEKTDKQGNSASQVPPNTYNVCVTGWHGEVVCHPATVGEVGGTTVISFAMTPR